MKIRTQVQLTEEPLRKLRQAARERGVSLAEMARRCVEAAIEGQPPTPA